MNRKPLLLAALLSIGAAQAAVAAPAPPQIPIKDFVRRDEFANPVLSPDGEHVVLSRRVQIDGKDVTVIVVHHLPDMKLLSTVRLAVFEVPLQYTWLTNKRLAVTFGMEEGSIEKPYLTGEIMAMDIDGERQKYLYGYKEQLKHSTAVSGDRGWAEISSVPASRDGRLFIVEHPFKWGSADRENHSLLYEVDSASGSRHLVTEIDKRNFDFLIDGQNRPRFALGSDDAAYQAVYRFDTTKQQWSELPGPDRANLAPVALSADGTGFYAFVSEGGGPRTLVRQSGDDGTRTVLAKDAVGSIDMVEWSAPPRVPIAAASALDEPRVRYLDAARPEAQLHKLLAAQFPGDHLHFRNFTDDGQKLLFSVASDRNPGDFYLFDRKTAKADLLFSAASWMDPERMPHRRPIAFKASDGLEIHGYLTAPTTPPADGKPPLILLPHGGPRSADEWFYDGDAAFLASRGYAVLQVNFRSSDGRGEAFVSAGDHRWGTRVQDDLIDGVRWAVAQGAVDPKRVCVYGVSFGGYSAMMAPTRAPGLFKCAVGYSGLYDLELVYKSDETRTERQTQAYLARTIGRDPAELQAQSPTHQADKIGVPVLLVHGGDDKRTEPAQAYAMRDALVKAGHPPEWFFVPGEGHGFYAEKNRQAFYERLEGFLAKHLAP